MASNSILNQQASRRIKISIDMGPKKVKDLSSMIEVSLVSNPVDLKIGGTVKLKCIIDDFDSEVYWIKKGYKLSDRAIATSNDNEALVTIKNFQKKDLGVYVCKARAIDSNVLKYKIKGEASYYLMPSDFGLSSQQIGLLGPEVNLRCVKGEEICQQNLNFGDKIELICEINEFGNFF